MGDNAWILDNLNDALTYWNNTLTEILTLLTTSPQDFRGGGVWSVIQNIHGTLQAVGYALLVLFFCFGVFKSAASVTELKRPEVAVKMFVRFALAQGAIAYGMELLLAMFSITQGTLLKVAGNISDMGSLTASLPQEISAKVAEVSFFSSIPLWIFTLIGYLFIIAFCFIMLLTIYGRFFRLFTFAAIAPIPLAAFAGESSAHMGRSFVKAYTGVCLEGVTIVIACAIFSAFANTPPAAIDPSRDAFSIVAAYLVDVLFNMLILVGTIKMSERITKELAGL